MAWIYTCMLCLHNGISWTAKDRARLNQHLIIVHRVE